MNARAESIEAKTQTTRKTGPRTFLVFVSLAALLVLAVVAGVSLGSANVEPMVVARVLLSKVLPSGWIDTSNISEGEMVVVWLIRAPRVLVAAFVGAGLAITGTEMQGLFKNPLASPDIVGTSAGASFGAVLSIALGLSTRSLFYLPLFAFIGALVALFVVYSIATMRGRTPVATLLLSGVALNALIGAATSFVISLQLVSYQAAQEILFWLMGGLDSRTWQHFWLIAPCVVVGVLISLAFMRELDLMLMGEEAASSLGVEVEHTKRIVLTSAALMTGAAVAVSGIVGFVGLVVPHIVRLLIGPSHKRLLPASALAGASFLIFADLLARTLIRPEEIRLGIITAAFGAPFFLYLLLRHKRESMTL
jgi:iron complex transport system permease protein